MAPTFKDATDLSISFGLVVNRPAAVEKQNLMLAEQVRVFGEQIQQQSNDQGPAANIEWVSADALTDHTEEELKALQGLW